MHDQKRIRAKSSAAREQKQITSQKKRKRKLNDENNSRNGCKAKNSGKGKMDKSPNKRKTVTVLEQTTSEDRAIDAASAATTEETKSQKQRKLSLKQKQLQDRVKMMFASSDDPYDKPLEWWEQEHVKYAFSFPPVRSRLELLMGSNVVRLTDRKYMLKLMSKIRQDHEGRQEGRIQERKTRELMRTKKMILNRLIPIQEAPAEIRQYPLFRLYAYCDAIIERRRQNQQASRGVKVPKALYKRLYPDGPEDKVVESISEEDDEGEGEGEESVPMKEIMVDGVPQLVPMTPEEIEKAEKERELAEDTANGYMYSREEYENLHYEADSVKKLKETRTVDEMYKKAHEIVGTLFSLVGDDKRKKLDNASSSARLDDASGSKH